MIHSEIHRSHRVGWLRAAVLGANDGIVSTASLVVGVAAANASHENILLAGAMSMAAGEYVSVSSQSDTEKADLVIEKRSIEQNYNMEEEELAKIYEERGLEPELAVKVAEKLMAHDALGAHARDEIGISESAGAQPVQAAFFSATTFTIGAALPMLVVLIIPGPRLAVFVATSSLLFLALLGGLAARAGGASMVKGAIRVTFWGALAMALTAAVGQVFGVVA
jgi:VIT1/CCC1 family predicted Fe2+/Mn2+ transporter